MQKTKLLKDDIHSPAFLDG